MLPSISQQWNNKWIHQHTTICISNSPFYTPLSSLTIIGTLSSAAASLYITNLNRPPFAVMLLSGSPICYPFPLEFCSNVLILLNHLCFLPSQKFYS